MPAETAVGVIGTGTIARTVHLPVLTSMPGVRVAWVADADEAAAAAVASAYRVPHLPLGRLEPAARACQAILLAIPVGVRARYYALLAKLDVGVLVEKPFARTRREHEEILALFAPHRLACGFMRRTYASTMQAAAVLREGWFGPPVGLRIREGARTTRTGVERSYFDDPIAGGGGVLLELGCHALDLAFHLTGASSSTIVSRALLRDGAADRRAEGSVLLERGVGGAPLPLEFVFSWLDAQENALEIEFAHVRLRLRNRPDAPLELVDRRGRTATLQVHDVAGAVTSNQAFFMEWRWFLDGLASQTPSAVAASSCLAVTDLLERLYATETVS